MNKHIDDVSYQLSFTNTKLSNINQYQLINLYLSYCVEVNYGIGHLSN